MSPTNDRKRTTGPQPEKARFYSPAEMLEWVLADEAFHGGKRSVREKLDDLLRQESWEHEIFDLAGRTADDLKLHEAHVGRIRQTRDSLLAVSKRGIIEALQDGAVVAFAHSSPASALRALPRSLWNFLDLNFEKATASGAGLTFSGILLVIWGHLTEDQREKISGRIDETAKWLADREWAARKPTEPPPGYEPDRPLHVVTKIDADTSEDLRRRPIHGRGGKLYDLVCKKVKLINSPETYFAEHLSKTRFAKNIQAEFKEDGFEYKLSSIKRELRFVLKGLSPKSE